MHDSHEIYEFIYNGFCVERLNKNKTVYTAKFKKWTRDPGIGIFECSDGKNRYIPTCAIKDFDTLHIHPKQDVNVKEKLLMCNSATS